MEQLTFSKKTHLSLWVFASVLLLGQKVVNAGGYVYSSQPLTQASVNASSTTTLNFTPTYNNAQFTDKVLVSGVNNHPIKTPSTADPVSTITGNNYHDELDFQIRGRNGLNYVFSRTNNSGKSAATTDVGLGYGWVHSYAMNLVSNDFGACPNCPAAQKPENADQVTSSITYTDERGGQANFLISPSTANGVTSYSITNPLSDFDSLMLDTPVAGQHTLAFRNGTQYIFQAPGGANLKTTPSVTAKLITIKNPWGDQLNINYDSSGRIATITDNLGISGRTGLSFHYANGDNHITSISDWAGRTWAYSYNSGYLSSYTDPLALSLGMPYTHYYLNTDSTYYNNAQTGVGYHLLKAVVKPLLRSGQSVYTLFNYYQNGRVINYTNAAGDMEVLDFDLYRQRTRVTDPRNHVREYDYDGNGFMTKMLEPDGGILYFSNQADNLRDGKTDALGYATQYSYCKNQSFTNCSSSTTTPTTNSDTYGNVTLEQDVLGNSIITTYNSTYYDQVASVTDKNGNTTNTSFYTTSGQQGNHCDLAGKPNTVSLKALSSGGTTTNNVVLQNYCWNSNGTLNSLNEYLDSAGQHVRTTHYTYDPSGLNVSDITVTATNTNAVIHTQYTYDNLGRVQTHTLNRTTDISNTALEALTTTYTYDALDRAIQVKNPAGRIQQTVYDGNGKVYQQISWYLSSTARTNCTGPVRFNGTSYVQCTEATYTYDAADRPISVQDIYGKVSTFIYDHGGNLISQTDANGHTVKTQYDAMNRVTALTDANGRTTQNHFNQRGDLISVTNPNHETVTNTYDELGRLTQVTDNMGNVTTFKYDKNGNKLCAVDGNGNSASGAAGHQPLNSQQCTVSFTYDQLNRLTQTTDAQNHVTAYAYNLLGQILSITDANQNITSFAYDDLGRLAGVTDQLTNTLSVVTDEAGNNIQITDRKGQVSQYVYDVLNRKTQSNYLADNTKTSYTYDNFDDLVQVQNEWMAYTYVYDGKHRLLSKTDSRLGLSESWSYDAADNIQSKTDYQGNVTTYQYDDSNRLAAETNPAYLQVSYHYDPAGRLLDRILSNNAKTSYQYDAGGRLSNLKNVTASGSVVNNTSYTRDAVGNILTAQEATGTNQPAGTSSFSYDPLYRLLKANYPNSANNETITYDAVGNRLTYQKGSLTLYSYYYAPNRVGSLTTGSLNGPLYETYNYDDNGNLNTIIGTLPGISSGRYFNLNWDAQNRLSSINNANINSNVSYQYDPFGNRIRKTPDLASNALNYYLQGDRLEAIYDVSGNVQAQYMRGSVIDEVVNGFQRDSSNNLTNYTYHHDALESVLGQSGNTGSILASQSNSAFGSTLTTTGASNNTLKYTGREQDGESGFYYDRARYYDPLTARFLSEDPLGFGGGINFYTYCGNNPVNCRDPFGLRPMIDSYPSFEAAAIVALLENNATKTEDGGSGKIEVGGSVYLNAPGDYRYIIASGGDSTTSDVPDIPAGTSFVGPFHTHGEYTTKFPDKWGNDTRRNFYFSNFPDETGDIPLAKNWPGGGCHQ